MSSRRRAPPDLATARRSRAAFNGAITKALDKLKAVKSTESVEILLIDTKDIDKTLKSIERTETGFLQTLEDAQEFIPEAEGAEAFHTEEDTAMENFNNSISAVRDLAQDLLTIKGVFISLGELTCDMAALTASLTEKPDSIHSSALQTLEKSFSALRLEWRKAHLPKDHPLKSELDACSKGLTVLGADVASARDKASPHPSPSSSSSDHCCGSNTKSDLPTIDVPTFNGDIMQWASFWAAFKSTIHDREDLSNTKKLIYLRKAVKDPDTQLLLHSPSESPDMYLEVVKELHLRFNRTREIHRNLAQSLLNLPTAKQTRVDLRRLVDMVKRTIDSLKATGHYDIDTFLTSLVYLTLPPRLQTLWEQNSKKEKGVPPVAQLLTFIREHAETLPSIQPTSGKPVENSEKKTPKRPAEKKQEQHTPRHRSNIHVVSPAPSYKWECSLCKPEKHPLYVYPKWLGYTVAQRLSHVQVKNLCSNCLAVGHATSTCKSTYRCRDCGQAHHTSIHQDATPPTPVHSTTVQSHQVPDALMMTAQVLLVGSGGHELKARALIDPGAGFSLVSRRVTQLLELPLDPNRMQFSAVQGTPCKPSKYLTTLTISPLQDKQNQIQCRAAVVQMVTCDLPCQPVTSVNELPHLMGLQLADTTYNTPGRIDILLGADRCPQIMVKRLMVTGTIAEPMAQPTIFGWAIMGPVQCSGSSIQTIPTHHTQVQVPDEGLDKLLTQFWETEEPEEIEAPLSLVEDQVQEHYQNTVTYSVSDHRYQVTLPRKPNMQPLGDSRTQALSRYFSNEKSILRRKVWEQFQEVVQGYLDLGHAEPVPASEPSPQQCYYLPMHSVMKQSSTSTKLRVVFDGSAFTTSGTSLNQALLVGPTLQPTLSNILIKFRSYPVALSADVSKMYREVELAPQDRDLHRFIWRPTPEQPVQDYRMTRVTFGVSASPYLAIRTLQQTAADHGEGHPIAVNYIRRSFYVVAGANTVEEALELFSSLRFILQKGGFNLCKWRSSSPAMLQNIPKDLQESLPVKDVTTLQSSSHPKALGLEWDSSQDCMSPSVHVSPHYRSTKRGIISDVSKTYDILGWIAPAVLSMKMLYQKLWQKGHEWDDVVPPDLAEQHQSWREQLPLLAQKQIPRCYSIPDLPFLTQELHGFSDASKKAYGAVVFIRTTYQHHPPVISLVTAKTKVAKLEPPTVPRLELCGAVLLTKILINVAGVLGIADEHLHAWTDSSIVLAWLDGQPRQFKTYVANRVSFILQATTPL